MNARRILGLTLVIAAIGIAIALRSSADSTAKPGDVKNGRASRPMPPPGTTGW